MADNEKDYEYYKNNLSVNDDLENISKDIKKEREYFNKHKDIQGAEQRLKELEAKEKVVNELCSKESKEPKYEIVNDFSIDAIKDNFTPPGAKSQKEDVKDEIDTNDDGKIEVDEMADFQKSLDDYASKNKKGRDDIPVTTRR